ncbi:TIGR01244 family sulfur transferase [Bergeriella denitrificans]|uniref:Uncharacterized protein conserved in bacteria n=1 Tax=Bergeriella denitrificans TaxID=494 RepID=A0A378UJX7_BERDE|nr:TIGR01244 family sulfur transferase [Bergeriella denitrificans]STZ76782.1 Uncharacterized protein conserved in bacteria [Bergeriella denitrificans]
MAILKISENLYISPQLHESDAQQAAALGIRSVVCNRPDGEEEGQPAVAEVQAWLAQAGIAEFHHQPVVAPSITAEDVARFQALTAQAAQPVLAYCRTGTRCSLLWAYHQVQHGMDVAAAKAAAAQAGVNLDNFDSRLQHAAEQGL